MRTGFFWLLIALLLLLAGCGAAAPGQQATAPTATPLPSPSATATPLPSPSATATPLPSPSATATATPLPSPSATATPSPRPGSPSGQTPVLPAVATSSAPTAAPVGGGGAPADLIGAMIADLSTRTGIDRAAVQVTSAEAITWSDGSLGCPQPGMAYPQVLIDGYRVVLTAEGRAYNYHADERGYFFLCEQPRP
jgi:hypothetical protein